MKLDAWSMSIILGLLALVAFGAGVLYSTRSDAGERIDFEGMKIRGELRSPTEFYYKRKKEEDFGNLTEKRKNFLREMRRDALLVR